MKKVVKFLSLGLLACSLVGCSCKRETTIESVLQDSSSVISGSKTNVTLSTQDIYKYIRENNTDDVNKAFLTYLMETILDFSNNNNRVLTYNLKVKDYFEENFLESATYKVNGVFNEELLVSELESKLYIIDKVNLPTSGPTVELGLRYDYSDYINRALSYNLYLEMLKEDYILTQKPNLLNDSRTRIINVYSSDDLEDMEAIVKDLFDHKYENLEDVSETKKQDDREEIGRQFCVNLGLEDGDYYDGTCSASTSSSTYDSALYKFTVCENGMRCSPSAGLAYQIKLIDETEYVKEHVVNKDTTGILYESALQQLLRSDVEDYLKGVIPDEDKFLINGLYNNDDEFSNKDIILSTGPDGTYYLVTVRIVNSQTTNIEDKEKALELLLSKVSETTVLLHYFEDLDVEVEDPQLQEYYNTLVGK